MKLSKKLLIAALLLIGAVSAAAAQSYRTYGVCYGLKERGYYGTPYGGGPNMAAAAATNTATAPPIATPVKRRAVLTRDKPGRHTA